MKEDSMKDNIMKKNMISQLLNGESLIILRRNFLFLSISILMWPSSCRNFQD